MYKYRYQQQDFNSEPKTNKFLATLALALFLLAYILASNDEFNTEMAETEFSNQKYQLEADVPR